MFKGSKTIKVGVAMSKLNPCKICGGTVSWCSYSECDGCHRIDCKDCKAQFDLIECIPNQNAETLDELRQQIAAFWNTRATPIAEIIEHVRALKRHVEWNYTYGAGFNRGIDAVIEILERYR